MRYLIDGYNLIHAIREEGLAPTLARDRVCKMIAAWARRCQADVTVVFDGFAPRGGVAEQIEQAGLTVRFAGSASADTVIEVEVAQASAPGNITVVTTDRPIQHEVRYHRARTMDSEQFAAQLFDATAKESPPSAAQPSEKPGDVSTDEVEEWVERFDSGSLDPPDRAS